MVKGYEPKYLDPVEIDLPTLRNEILRFVDSAVKDAVDAYVSDEAPWLYWTTDAPCPYIEVSFLMGDEEVKSKPVTISEIAKDWVEDFELEDGWETGARALLRDLQEACRVVEGRLTGRELKE